MGCADLPVHLKYSWLLFLGAKLIKQRLNKGKTRCWANVAYSFGSSETQLSEICVCVYKSVFYSIRHLWELSYVLMNYYFIENVHRKK